jgi:hypothetical protein
MALIDRWLKHPERIEQNEQSEQDDRLPPLPDGYDDPSSWRFVQPELRQEYRRQLADADAEMRREMKAERAAGQGTVLGSFPIEAKAPLSTATTRIDVLNLDRAEDRKHFVHGLRIEAAKQASHAAQTKQLLKPGLDSIAPPACQGCGTITAIELIKITNDEQYRLCPSCARVALADVVEHDANEIVPGGDTRRDAISKLRNQRSQQQNGERAS